MSKVMHELEMLRRKHEHRRVPIKDEIHTMVFIGCKYCNRASCVDCIVTIMKIRFMDRWQLDEFDFTRVMDGAIDEFGNETGFHPNLGG